MSLILSSKTILRRAACGLVCGLALTVSACGIDGVELNGKVFDAVGLNTGSVRSGDPKMRERAPLVVPPGLESLPAPGSASPPPEADALAQVTDHDAKRNVSKDELQRQQQAFCDKNYSPNKALGDETIDMIEGPLGPCRGSIFSAVKNFTKGDSAE